ncbi:hypothetical protein [Reichenbachiella sp.]|uniref:hypothetical protein n=1 Tax=Reichenbachiella sp. TaxID=2184521 RepID=UPI00329A1EF7
MKKLDYKFPYPVLGFGDDIDTTYDFDHSITTTDESDHYVVSIDVGINNTDLEELLKNGSIVLACEVNCTGTLFRRIFKSSDTKLVFELSKFDLRGKVEFECYLLASKPISNYSNSQAHQDFREYSFNIGVGEILAFFEYFHFHADINYRKLKAVASFMEVTGEDDIELVKYDLENPKILVKLPMEDYDKFSQDVISKEEKFAAIFHSSIVFNALLYALMQIKEFQNQKWAEVLKVRMTEPELLGLSLDEPNDLMDITQIILGKPISRLLESLEQNILLNEEIE